MPRHKLLIEYDGGAFHGWQRQADLPSVQAAIEDAIAAFSGETPRLTAAGRTDTGVHATGQVAHLDLERERRPDVVRDAANAHLKHAGHAVAVLSAEFVAPEFDARMSALARHYRYRIVNRRAPLALERARAWHVPRPLDLPAMRAAAPALLGRHDFTTFRAADCQANSPLRTLDRFEIEETGETIDVWASARSFLHHQVRGMVGSLAQVGLGRWPPEALGAALAAADRARCGPLAPPQGLTLFRVDY